MPVTEIPVTGSVRDESQPTGYRSIKKVVSVPPWRDVWRVQASKTEPRRGSLFVLVRGSRDKRKNLTLGWMPKEEACLYCRGMNALCRERQFVNSVCRAMIGRDFLPPDPPVRAAWTLPLPVQGGGRTIPAVSDDWLVAVMRAGTTEAEKQIAREKVLGFLRRMAELEPHAPPTPAEAMKVVEAARRARTGIDPGALTIREYVGEIWEPKRKEADPGYWRREEGLLRLYVLPRLGHHPLRDLDHRDVYAAANAARKRDGSPVSYNTKRLILTAVSVMWMHAVAEKHVHREWNLMGLELKGSTVKPLEQDSLGGAQVTAILSAVDGARDRALLAACFGTGGRPEEIVRLAWEHVRWTATERHPHGTIRLSGEVPGVEVRQKNEYADRSIPMAPFLRGALHAYWMELGQPIGGIIFLTPSGKPYAIGDGASYYRKLLGGAVERAGLGGVRVTPYTLRHTFGTLLHAMGLKETQIKLLMGHSKSSRVFLETYDHSKALSLVAELPDIRCAVAHDDE